MFDCIPAMKALGEETRIRIVRLLLKREHSVNALAEILALGQYNISKHLRVLRQAGLVEDEKQAQQRIYRLADNFRQHLGENDSVLDLGCCRFDFKKLAS